MNETQCCDKCLGHGLPANLPKINVAPVQGVPFCLDHTCSCHQSKKPHPFLAEENIMKAIRAANQEQRKLVDEYNAKQQPKPEQWFEELEMYKKSATEAIMTFDPMHTFCTICGTDPEKLITHLKEVLDSVLLAQKEQMLEVVRGIRGRPPLCDRCAHHVCEYQVALSDVEEKIRKL